MTEGRKSNHNRMAAILRDQREKLDLVNMRRSGHERFRQARKLGCLVAVAKGVKYRKLERGEICIPYTEFTITNGRLHIPALKTVFPVPTGMDVRAVVFRRDNTSWYGVLEVTEKKAAAAA